MRASQPPYRVERAEPLSVAATLIGLWQRNLPLEGEAGAKLDWLYRQAPIRPRHVFLLRAGESAVGTAGMFVRRMQLGGRVREAALLGDFAVETAHRTLLPALSLMRAVRRHARAEFGLVYGFPNQLAAGVCLRVSYIELGSMIRYARVLRHDRFVRRVLDVPVLTSAASRTVDATRALLRWPAGRRALSDRQLCWLDRADARFDRLWSVAAQEYAIAAERSAAFVNWRLVDHPTERCQLVALATHDQSEITAYAALHRTADDVVHLRDLFGRRVEVGRLIDALVPTLWRRGVASISMRVCGDAEVADTLAARGFVPRDRARLVIADAGEALPAELEAELRNPKSWYLTDADEDT